MTKKKIVIIGGGFTGLAAASQLFHDFEVHLLEKKNHLGGLAAGFREPEWKSSLEYYYHHWFESDQYVQKYIKQWGIDRSKLIFRDLFTVLETRKHGFVQLDSAFALLKYPELNLFQKIRMGFCLAFLRQTKNWKSLERFTTQEWCEKYMGKSGYDEIWKPLLLGKFGVRFAHTINMAWLWARLATRTKKLGTFVGGFHALIEGAETFLSGAGVKIYKNIADCKVTSAQANHGDEVFSVDLGEKRIDDVAAVLVAAAPSVIEKTIGSFFDADELQHLIQRPALGVREVILSLRRPLNTKQPYYWYSLRKNDDQPFLALIEHTHFISSSEFNGEHLIYLATYLDPESDAFWNVSDEEFFAAAIKTCRKIDQSFDLSAVNRKWFFKERFAQPIMQPDASKNIPSLVCKKVFGLYCASMSHVYPWDRGTNFALELGEKVAKKIKEDLLSKMSNKMKKNER